MLTSLGKNLEQLGRACQVPMKETEMSTAADVIDEWQRKNDECPPTWRSLFQVLKELDLERLSQQIKDYLGSE